MLSRRSANRLDIRQLDSANSMYGVTPLDDASHLRSVRLLVSPVVPALATQAGLALTG
jgi:hypothetical protein